MSWVQQKQDAEEASHLVAAAAEAVACMHGPRGAKAGRGSLALCAALPAR